MFSNCFLQRRFLCVALMGCVMFSFSACHSDTVSDADIAALQYRLDSINAAYGELCSSAEEYADRLSDKDSMIRAQADEIQSLITQLHNARSSAGSTGGSDEVLREKNTQIAQLRSQLNAQEKQLKRLETAAQRSNGNVSADLQSQIEGCRNQVLLQERQIADLNSQIAGLNGSLSARDNTISALQDEKKALSQQVDNLHKQSEKLNGQLSVLSKGQADAQQLIECQQRVSMLQGESDGLHAQIEQLQKQIGQSGYDAQKMSELNKQVTDLQSQVTLLQQQLQQKDAQLSAIDVQISGDATRQINALQQQVAQQQGEIERLNNELKAQSAAQQSTSLPKSNVTVNTANMKLSELQAMCESYAQEIEQLRAENARLHSENEQLRTNMAQVQRDAEKALSDNSELVKKVEQASILVADNLTATPAKSVSGTSVKSTEKASQVVGVRIEGRLLDNNVVDPGTITIYARIADANNRIVANGTPESFDMQGVPMQYTQSQDIEFTGAGRKVVMVWRKLPATELKAGLYWLTLYANGNEIGKTSFRLK